MLGSLIETTYLLIRKILVSIIASEGYSFLCCLVQRVNSPRRSDAPIIQLVRSISELEPTVELPITSLKNIDTMKSETSCSPAREFTDQLESSQSLLIASE